MIPGDGVLLTMAVGTGEQAWVGTGSRPGAGDRLGFTGTAESIISAGVRSAITAIRPSSSTTTSMDAIITAIIRFIPVRSPWFTENICVPGTSPEPPCHMGRYPVLEEFRYPPVSPAASVLKAAGGISGLKRSWRGHGFAGLQTIIPGDLPLFPALG